MKKDQIEKFTESNIKFEVGEKTVKFKIIHNLPDISGLSLEDALNSWLARTDTYTDKSFVDYIKSKNTEFHVFTEQEFNLLFKTIEI